MDAPTPDLSSQGSPREQLACVLVIISVIVLAITGCGGSTASTDTNGAASFVGRASNAAVFIQWTRAGDSLSGSLQEAIEKEGEDSGVESSSRAFTGTVDGNGLTLTLNEGLGSTNALVGKMSGDGFAMTFPGVGHRLITIIFAPGQVSDYNAAVRELEGTTTATLEQAPPSSSEQSTTPTRGALVGSDCETVTGRGTLFSITAGVGVSCPTARGVFRDLLAGKGERHEGTDSAESYTRVDGWTCGSGTGGFGCSRSGARIEANAE